MKTRDALIELNLIPGLGSATIHRLLEAFDSPEAVFQAHPALLKEILKQYATSEVLQAIRQARDGAGAAPEINRVERAGAKIVTLVDDDYPELLKTISDPPPVLYVKGILLKEDAAAVGLVGTRSASPYGIGMARQLASDLAQSGLTVVSGLAEGIDAAGHEGALEAGGRTIAVLGHGLSHTYPPQHRKLAERIVESGALISEFPMEMPPAAANFPRRNRVISGLSLGVIVVEAPTKSGALITAREALEQGREVFAVPGPVSSVRSRGCHQLLRDGARLVEDSRDVLEELAPALKEQLSGLKQHVVCSSTRLNLSREEHAVYEAIPVGEATVVDSLVEATALSPARVLPLLTTLELKGLICQVPGQGYSRAS